MRALLSSLLCAALAAAAAKPLEIFFIDVEGGQATLIVSPSGHSMLVDTGWPGYSNRDANRIAAAAHKAGIKKIDYVFITHFHTDHVGGAKQLADRIPVGTFVDKGKTVENDKNAKEMMEIYDNALATSGTKNGPKPKRLIVKAETSTGRPARSEARTSATGRSGPAVSPGPRSWARRASRASSPIWGMSILDRHRKLSMSSCGTPGSVIALHPRWPGFLQAAEGRDGQPP